MDENFKKHGFYYLLPVIFEKKMVISMQRGCDYILKMVVSIIRVSIEQANTLKGGN